MSSEESDDEPLSVLASKKQEAENAELEILPIYASEVKSTKSKNLKKECDVSISLQPSLNEQSVVERPTDVWLYLTDLNTCGPFSCLLCSEWFLNKARIVIHYVVDHRKDYCGICRYFVPNREAWWEHLKFHTPWKCSQCTESFDTEKELRQHFSSIHNLVHCRLCYLRLPDNEEYHNHLFQKHGTSDISGIRGDSFWEFQYPAQKFFCLLCLKKFDLGKQFSDHFIAFHHFTLKCLTFLICGTDLQFNIKGVDLSQEFIETELKLYSSYGYVDFQKCLKIKDEMETEEVSITVDCDPGIKEVVEDSHSDDNLKLVDGVAGYRGDVDFDVTLIELILLPKCYHDYVSDILKKIDSKVMPHSTEVSYLNPGGSTACVNCFLCKDLCKTVTAFESHMSRAHSVKTLPLFWCRVCAADFENGTELENHSKEELAEFEDLWICQFCEKEFDGREETRKHLTEHFSIIDYDNCFSPHLGFKCKYCPTLFWNETDREMHHIRVHIQRHKNDFYPCLLCGEVFSDKIFFVYHYIEKHGTKTTHLLRCRLCGVMLENIDEMRSHFKSDHPLSRRIFCCMDACKFRPFQHRKALLLHMKSIHDPASKSTRSTTCSVCGQQFASNKARASHTLQAHGLAKFKCTLCAVVLLTADERKFHYLIRHPGRYQYQCDMCDKSFQYKSSLYMHKHEHSPHKKDYACNYCGKVFMKKDSFREHVQIHEAPRHACSYCPMRFVQRSNMLRHERRHTGERPYSCNYCPRTFSDKGACTSHTRTHVNNTSYVCVYCGQAFAQKSKLKYHIRKHTGENLETCQICAKKFTSACALREHMRVHQKQNMKKTVKCPLCKNMYPTEKDMIRHMRGTHTGARYKCPLCRKLVSSTGSLRDHVLTHTRVKAFRCKSCPKTYNSRKTIIKHLLLRHHVKRSEVNSHYHHLDPKECNIDLNDDIMKKLFSNLKRKPNANLFKEFLATNKDIIESKKEMVKATKRSTRKKQENVDGQENVDSPENADSQENPNAFVNVIEEVSVKLEPCSYSDNSEDEIPPSDFVNVKIECVEENKIEAE